MSDGELSSQDLNLKTAFCLREAGPWGSNFPEPLFDGKFRILEQRLIRQRHLKLVLSINSEVIEAIAFNVDTTQWPNAQCTILRAAYRLGVNYYRGCSSLQLILEYLEPCVSA